MAFSKKILICTVLILLISIIAGLFPVHGESEIYDTVVRLHILANSDSPEDQELKLKVRDKILDAVTPQLEDCSTQGEAIARLEKIAPDIIACAEQVIRTEGYDYQVKIELGNEYYPKRRYESCAFPEGEYVSMRVLIGDGEGQNWWCCLFPPLCLLSATEADDKYNEEAFISVGLTSDQYKLITESETPKYKVRFKILEVFERLFNKQ